MTLAKVLLVNSIVDFSSYCTSIIAITGLKAVHVRNLDFDFPTDMQELIYIQQFTKGGKTLAKAPSVAPFYGVYTAVAEHFGVSYNVRFSANNVKTKEDMWMNLELEVNNKYKPMQNLLFELVTQDGLLYDDAFDKMSDTPINAPCFIAVSNADMKTKDDKWGIGGTIARSREGVDRVDILSAYFHKAYVAVTNRDFWRSDVDDPRYDLVQQQMAKVEKYDHQTLIKEVLDF